MKNNPLMGPGFTVRHYLEHQLELVNEIETDGPPSVRARLTAELDQVETDSTADVRFVREEAIADETRTEDVQEEETDEDDDDLTEDETDGNLEDDESKKDKKKKKGRK